MANKPRALILGATGQIGSEVLRRIAADSELEVNAAVRSIGKASTIGAPTIWLDYDRPETLAPALSGIDRLFLATGYTIRMFRQSRDVLNAARRVGVKHVVHLGAPGDDDTPVEHWLWHQFVERYIEWCGFSFTHLRPEIFMENLLGYGGARVLQSGVIRHYVADTRITWVSGEDVAEIAVRALRDPAEHGGKTYRIGSDIKSYGEIAAILTRVVGRPFRYESRPATEFLDAVSAAGAEAAYMLSVFENYAAYASGERKGGEKTFDTYREITGLEPTSIEGFVKKHVNAFTY